MPDRPPTDAEPGVDARDLDRRAATPLPSPAGADARRDHPANQSETQAGRQAADHDAERPETTEPG